MVPPPSPRLTAIAVILATPDVAPVQAIRFLNPRRFSWTREYKGRDSIRHVELPAKEKILSPPPSPPGGKLGSHLPVQQ